jgi:hypothetical protein
MTTCESLGVGMDDLLLTLLVNLIDVTMYGGTLSLCAVIALQYLATLITH